MSTTRGHKDVAHHHPKVCRLGGGGPWVWVCDCGGASCRTRLTGAASPASWRDAVLGALHHSMALAP